MASNFAGKCREFLAKHRPHALLPPAESGPTGWVSPLVKILYDETNEQILEQAARYLGMIGTAAVSAVDPLVTIIRRNPITPTRDEIELKLDRNLPWTISTATRAALDALRQISPGKGIRAISELCNDVDPQVRYRAALTLQTLCEPADHVVPLLMEFLHDPAPEIRRAAILALWQYATLDEATLDAALLRTMDKDLIVRLRADYLLAKKLSNYQRKYPNGASELFELIRSTEGPIPIDATETVCMIGEDAGPLVEEIVGLLQPDTILQMPAVTAIAFFLGEIILRFPSLATQIHFSLEKIASPTNQSGRFVKACLDCALAAVEFGRSHGDAA